MSVEYEFLQRVVLALSVGALIGLEREYTKKQQTVGLRSFALVSLLGCMTVLLSQPVLFQIPVQLPYLPYIGLIVVIGYAFLVYYFMAKKEFFGITTTLALPLTYLFGMFIGYGLFLDAIIGTVVLTLLLYSRRYSHLFVSHLTETEMADALQFAIVLFIIYPILPADTYTLFGFEIMLKKFIEIIILLSLMSFAGFIAVRLLGPKVLPLTAFFGGLVSALSVVATFSNRSKARGADQWMLSAGISAASVASLLSDIILIAYTSAALLSLLFPTYAMMIFVLLLASLPFLRHGQHGHFKVELGQPFSVVYGVKFAIAFLAVLLATQYIATFGAGALLAASFIAGLASVTSVVVSISLQVSGGTLPVQEGARAIFAATLAGLIAKAGVLAFAAAPALRRKALPMLMAAIILGSVALFLTAG